jgi:hypothetical protein
MAITLESSNLPKQITAFLVHGNQIDSWHTGARSMLSHIAMSNNCVSSSDVIVKHFYTPRISVTPP